MAKKGTYKQGISQEFVDEETGEFTRQTVITEVIEGYVDVKLPEKHRLNNGNFIVLFQKAMLEIALNRKYFDRFEIDLLLYLLGTAGIGNSIYIDYPTIMESLKLDYARVNKAVNRLEKKGIVLRQKAKSRQHNEAQLMEMRLNFDQLNYNLAYNGKIKDFSKVRHDHPPLSISEPKKSLIQLEISFE